MKKVPEELNMEKEKSKKLTRDRCKAILRRGK
jgi:hypothetical protein